MIYVDVDIDIRGDGDAGQWRKQLRAQRGSYDSSLQLEKKMKIRGAKKRTRLKLSKRMMIGFIIGAIGWWASTLVAIQDRAGMISSQTKNVIRCSEPPRLPNYQVKENALSL